MASRDYIDADERTDFVEKASYGLGYKLLAYGLLIDVAYRSFRFGEASWDLLALVIFSGGALAVYQLHHRILGRRWLRLVALSVAVAAAAALLLATVLRM